MMGNCPEKEPHNLDGGFDADFAIPLPDELTCCICFLAFRDPMQLSCGHQYCRSCLEKCLRNQGAEFACPVDRLPVDQNRMFPDKALERRVLSLQVKCSMSENGCNWKGELRNVEQHDEECNFVSVNCSKCMQQVPKLKLGDHELYHCDFRVLSCGLCNVNYMFRDENMHNNVCKYWPVECSNACGEEVPRYELDKHLLQCPLAQRSSIDDTFSYTFEEKIEIREKYFDGNVRFLTTEDRILHLEDEMKIIKEKNAALERQLFLQQSLFDEQRKESEKREAMLLQRIERLENNQESFIDIKESSEDNFMEPSSIPPLPQFSEFYSLPCSSKDSSDTKVSSPALLKGVSSNNSLSVANLIRQAQELRYGIFVWKVSNVESNKKSHQCLFSETFYTSKDGYKLRLQAWLNGHGIGMGTCISLFVQLVKGVNDKNLTWPFPLKSTISILNQLDPGLHRHRSNDPSKAGLEAQQNFYSRPKDKVNNGFGNGTALISQRNALSNGFIVNDALYFMFRVDS